MALTEIDKSLGFVALHQRLVSKNDLDQCVGLLQQNPAQGLGPLLVQCGLIPPNRLDDLMRQAHRHLQSQAQASGPHAVHNVAPLGASNVPVHSNQIRSMQSGKFRLEDVNPGGRSIPSAGSNAHQQMREQYEEYVLGHLLMRRNYISQEQLNGVYSRKGTMQSGAMSLGQQLVREGYLQPHLLQPLVDGLRRKIVTCNSCGNCDYREPQNVPQQYPCKRCGAQMVMPAGGMPIQQAPQNPGFNPAMQSGAMSMQSGMMPMQSGAMQMQSGAMPMQSGAMQMQSGAMPGMASNFGGSPVANGFQPSGTFAASPGVMQSSMNSGAFGVSPGMSNTGFNSPAPPVGMSSAGYNPSSGFNSPGGFGSMPSGQVAGFNPSDPGFDPSQPMEPEGTMGGDDCPETFGDYIIEREIARGGMGVVYLARKNGITEDCALKVMLQEFSQNPKRLRRFQREIDAHEKLVHDNIVRILDSGKVDEFYYLTMEFVDGKPLDEKLKEDLELEIVMEMLEKICRATDYAHSMGVVHRDLKPANVIVTTKMVPKLTDFGLAKNADHVSVLTKTGAVVGTPYYLSPEQASGRSKDVDERADVYALGVMMYEMITGRLPFTGKTSVELFRKIIHDDPIPPTKIKPQLTEQIERVCLKALEKKREDRYQSAGAFADDIRCLIDGKPISARKPSMVKNLVRNVKKKGLGPVVVIGFVVLFLLGTAVGTYLYIQSVQNAHKAAIQSEWDAYSQGINSDTQAVKDHLKKAKELTLIERGQEALEHVHRAMIRLAMLEFRIGKRDDGSKILKDAGNIFEGLRNEITNGDPTAIANELKKFKVNIKEWPEELKLDENKERAFKELTNNVNQERLELLAKAYIARGYAKIVLPDNAFLEKAQFDFQHVVAYIVEGNVLATVAKGDLFMAKGNLEMAVTEYKKATKQAPVVEAYVGWIQALLWRENYIGANQVIQRAIKVPLGDEGLAEISALRALTAILRGNASQAENTANEAVQLNPDSYNTWLVKGLLHAALGDHLLARRPFEKAIQLAGNNPVVLIQLTKHFIERHLYDQALNYCDRALQMAPYSMEARAYKAVIYEHKQEFKRARKIALGVLDDAKVRHWRAQAIAAMCLSRIEASHNSFPKANEYARKARTKWPCSETWLHYGYVLLNHENREDGEVTRALEIGNNVINESKNTTQGNRLVALSMVAQGKEPSHAKNKLWKLIERKLPRDARLRTEFASLLSKERGSNEDKSIIQRQREEAIICERDASTLEGNFLLRALALRNEPIAPDVDRNSQALGEKINRIRTTLREINFINPVNVHALHILGMMAIERADWSAAYKYLKKAREINPEYAPTYLALLRLESGANGLGDDEYRARTEANYSKSESRVKNILGNDLKKPFIYVPLHVNRAEFEFRMAEDKASDSVPAEEVFKLLAAYDEALKSFPNALRFIDPKIKRLEDLRNRPTEAGKKAKGQLAELKQLRGQIEKARKQVYESLKPTLEKLRTGQRSNRDFWGEVKRCPDLSIAWECLVRESILSGDVNSAVAGLARLSVLHPARGDLFMPVLELCKSKDADGLVKNGLKVFETKAGIKPDLLTATILDLIAHTNQSVSTGAIGEASASVKKWLRLHPQFPILHAVAAKLTAGEKNYKRAISLMSNARILAGDSPLFALEVARLSVSANDFDTALRLLIHVENQGTKLTPEVLDPFTPIKESNSELWKTLIEKQAPKDEEKGDEKKSDKESDSDKK